MTYSINIMIHLHKVIGLFQTESGSEKCKACDGKRKQKQSRKTVKTKSKKRRKWSKFKIFLV